MQRFHAESSDPGSSPLNEARKVVISRTLTAPLTWMNSTLVAGDGLDVVPRLKAESPVPLRCHGSIRMNRALLAAGLFDRLEVMVFPVITGESGRNPVLAGLPDIDLELVDSRTFDGRVQQLVYRISPMRSSGTPAPTTSTFTTPTSLQALFAGSSLADQPDFWSKAA